MSAIRIEHLCKSFGAVKAIQDVTFEVEHGQLVSVVGPTNAGKTTLLKLIAGIYKPDSGQIWLNDENVTPLTPRDRNVSMLFQSMALFPTLTGRDNIAFPLRVAKLSPAAVETQVNEAAEILQITHILSRLPKTFSGGERQRTAIARAIVGTSDILMLDEPLTNLDAQLRIKLRGELKSLHKRLGRSILHVTHDQIEAMSLSDKIIVIDKGVIQQVGTPEAIYDRPVNDFVAKFIGSPGMNLINVSVADNGTVVVLGGDAKIPVSDLPERIPSLPNKLGLGVRAEEIRVSGAKSTPGSLRGNVQWIERMGNRKILRCNVGSDQPLITASVAPNFDARTGDAVWLNVEAHFHRLIDWRSRRFLSTPNNSSH